jgi:hypothetical protein
MEIILGNKNEEIQLSYFLKSVRQSSLITIREKYIGLCLISLSRVLLDKSLKQRIDPDLLSKGISSFYEYQKK